jgi:DNA mismatch endonuclease (patch repair protein)
VITPAPSSLNARNTMRANRSVSGVEQSLRKAVWALGGRGYRVRSHLPGHPDLIFPSERIAVFVHGCFWHLCPTCKPPRPKANADFWATKLDQNVLRDRRVENELSEEGWEVVVIWEHAIRASAEDAARGLLALRSERRDRTIEPRIRDS